jgi:hypothetical protein
MKAYGGVDVYIHIFLTSALVGSEWSASRPGHFTPGKRAASTHWIKDWVGVRAGLDRLDDVEKRKFLILPGLILLPLGRPVRSQSLYRRRYPDKNIFKDVQDNIAWLAEAVSCWLPTAAARV